MTVREAIPGIPALSLDRRLSPREDIQARPEPRKESARSAKPPVLPVICGAGWRGPPHVCGLEGAVADTWSLRMGHMSQGLDGALFLALENYSLLYFKGILMRTLEAPGTPLGRSSVRSTALGVSWSL